MADDIKLARLAALSLDVRTALPPHVLDEVADLTLRIHQASARAAGALLPPAMTRTYSERREDERHGMRSAVEHVVEALVLLDLIELPG